MIKFIFSFPIDVGPKCGNIKKMNAIKKQIQT